MIPSLEELRKLLVPAVGPDSASNSFFKRNPRLSTTPTRSDLPLSSDSPAPQLLSAPARHHSTAQTARPGDSSAVEHAGAEIGVGSSHSDDQVVQNLAGEHSPQRGVFHFRRLAADAEDENPTKQRRYFAKTGKWIDNEEEELAARNGSNGSEELIFDRRPVDLRTLFPKLSLR